MMVISICNICVGPVLNERREHNNKVKFGAKVSWMREQYISTNRNRVKNMFSVHILTKKRQGITWNICTLHCGNYYHANCSFVYPITVLCFWGSFCSYPGIDILSKLASFTLIFQPLHTVYVLHWILALFIVSSNTNMNCSCIPPNSIF